MKNRITLFRKGNSVLIGFSAVLVMVAFLFSGMRASALIITPIWDSSITNDPDAAIIENTINTAIQFYQARFSDPITVTIEFKGKTNGLGSETHWYWDISYSNFITALRNDATTTNDFIALESLSSDINPVSGAGIRVETANLRAIGITNKNSGLAGGVDGIIRLNTSAMNLSRSSINPKKYDLMVVAEHEIDEVLGLGAAALNSGDDIATPEDLFRYDTNGNRSFTTNGDDAYFSIDGTNLLARFNQTAGLDYGDWWVAGPHPAQVQDAEIRAGATPDLGVELTALDVIGYNLLPLPQPGITGIGLSEANLLLDCTNGLASATYYVMASTNLSLSLNQWSSIATNMLSENGDFSITVTNAVDPSIPQRFYILKLQ